MASPYPDYRTRAQSRAAHGARATGRSFNDDIALPDSDFCYASYKRISQIQKRRRPKRELRRRTMAHGPNPQPPAPWRGTERKGLRIWGTHNASLMLGPMAQRWHGRRHTLGTHQLQESPDPLPGRVISQRAARMREQVTRHLYSVSASRAFAQPTGWTHPLA